MIAILEDIFKKNIVNDINDALYVIFLGVLYFVFFIYRVVWIQ